MLLLKLAYNEDNALNRIVDVLSDCLGELERDPVFICLGSNRHILDCFGPMAGTMLCEKDKRLCVYGTLDQPLHARNLAKEIKKIKAIHNGAVEIAIDAAVSKTDPLGTINIRKGEIFPGRALYKNLPPVGSLSITGIIDEKFSRGLAKSFSVQSIAHVYHMAALISDAVVMWNKKRYETKRRRSWID